MDILVIGGTRFLGKHFTLQAVARGHRVTLFNRGTQPLPSSEVEHIQGDRNQDLERLENRDWDTVIDTCGYFPKQLEQTTDLLKQRAGHYCFISSISVYADQTRPYQTESAPLVTLEEPTTEEITPHTYGGLKVLCEHALTDAYPAHHLIVRPGLIVGPDDPTDRFTYWPVRVASGGEVLAPDKPSMPIQYIDVRDLASWLLDMAEQQATGTYNAVTTPDSVTMGALLATAKQTSGSQATFTWVDEGFLLQHEVQPFMELPLWIPGDAINFSKIDNSKAAHHGLITRSLQDTVQAVLPWRQGTDAGALRAGMTAEREHALLQAWKETRGTV